MKAWLQFQQQWVDGWSQAVRQGGSGVGWGAPPGSPPGPFPFGAAFGAAAPFPWGGMGGLDPTRLAQQFLRAGALQDIATDAAGWQRSATERMEELRRYWAGALGGLRAAYQQLLSMREFGALLPPSGFALPVQEWAQPLLDAWQGWGGLLGRVTGLPGLGQDRNRQEAALEAMRLYWEAQEAALKFHLYLAEGIPEVLDRMRDRCTRFQPDPEHPIATSRAVYDLCVDCCEEVYAKRVAGEEFSRLHGELHNTGLRLQKHLLGQVNKFLRAAGLPDGETVTTLQQRQQELRRELRELRSELQTLRTQAAGDGRPATPQQQPEEKVAKKKVAKKKVAKKKVTEKTAARVTERRDPVRSGAVRRKKTGHRRRGVS